MVPGLEVARVGAYWAITSRGLNTAFSSKLQVLIDGRSIFYAENSSVYWHLNSMNLGFCYPAEGLHYLKEALSKKSGFEIKGSFFSDTQSMLESLKNNEIDEGLLNMVEMAFRAYDPCFACASHTLPGGFALEVKVFDAHGDLLKVLKNF